MPNRMLPAALDRVVSKWDCFMDIMSEQKCMGEVSIGDRAAAPSRQLMHVTNTGAPFQARLG